MVGLRVVRVIRVANLGTPAWGGFVTLGGNKSYL